MKTSNIFQNIPQELGAELFENIVSKDNVKIERIVSKGHTSPQSGWYIQESDEWVIVLSGEAVLSFDSSDDVRLKSGDYINIPAGTKHRVSWTTPEEETLWLAVHY